MHSKSNPQDVLDKTFPRLTSLEIKCGTTNGRDRPTDLNDLRMIQKRAVTEFQREFYGLRNDFHGLAKEIPRTKEDVFAAYYYYYYYD